MVKNDKNSLFLNITGKTYELTLKNDSLPGNELAKIKDGDGEPLRLYDPGYMNVINCVEFCTIQYSKDIRLRESLLLTVIKEFWNIEVIQLNS